MCLNVILSIKIALEKHHIQERTKEKISYTKVLKIQGIMVEINERNLVKFGSLSWTVQTKNW